MNISVIIILLIISSTINASQSKGCTKCILECHNLKDKTENEFCFDMKTLRDSGDIPDSRFLKKKCHDFLKTIKKDIDNEFLKPRLSGEKRC